MSYQLHKQGVIRRRDGASIPQDTSNRDWREYQEWLADGHVPDPADPPPAPVDRSDSDTLDKPARAVLLCLAEVGGLTGPQAKALFKRKWDALP